jgi:glycosyltransferase involved in cell wall biosynthesis
MKERFNNEFLPARLVRVFFRDGSWELCYGAEKRGEDTDPNRSVRPPFVEFHSRRSPHVVLEAMSLSLPVVTTAVCGTAEVVLGSEN